MASILVPQRIRCPQCAKTVTISFPLLPTDQVAHYCSDCQEMVIHRILIYLAA